MRLRLKVNHSTESTHTTEETIFLTFLVKETVLDEFLQELSEGSGSLFTRVR